MCKTTKNMLETQKNMRELEYEIDVLKKRLGLIEDKIFYNT